MKALGKGIDRVDGRLKVTGAAKYAADHTADGLAYGVPVVSTIARGRVKTIDSRRAEQHPGFIAILTRQNTPPVHMTANDFGSWTKLGESRLLFADDQVHYAGQYLALVVAGTFEQATAAAALVDVIYEEEKPFVDTDDGLQNLVTPTFAFGPIRAVRGNFERSLAEATHHVDQHYSTPIEHHNPMEPSATVAVWNGDELTLYDATQWVMGARNSVADMLQIPREKVHIVSQFVGGGFGCKGFIWPHQAMAAVAAKMVGRPVKVALSRRQMFAACGHRPATRQHVEIAAAPQGRLLGIRHHSVNQTSFVEDFTELCGTMTSFLYECPSIDVNHHLIRLNIATPTPMRAPGETPGLFALESALDELAYAAKVDPLELRLRNYADRDPESKLPFSGEHLRECYQVGRKRFEWDARNPAPKSMRDGRCLIGYGMATATYPGMRLPGAAAVQLFADGRAEVTSATQDMGTGTYTTMTQITGETLGIPLDRIHASLGDSWLPPAPVSGGSMTTASITPAVKAACQDALANLIRAATDDAGSPFHGMSVDRIVAVDGRLKTTDGKIDQSYEEAIRSAGVDHVDGRSFVQPGEELGKFSFHSFGVQFVKVRVDPDLGSVRVDRVVSVFDVGRIINPKTALSQAYSGITQGIGMALMEETVYDERNGSIVSGSLADYLLPVNADIPDIDVTFLDVPDYNISSIGARGLGEITITGVAPAIANAVYHATGVRVRDLPITVEKLMGLLE
jgi:xanthine dehydrogenase YagR molybdenum-binding subunit